MTKIAFRRQFDPNYKGAPAVQKFEKSLTVPDMHCSIHELIKNHVRGVGSGVATLDGLYTDEEIPKYDDITDIYEHKRELRRRQKILDDQAKAERKEAEDKRALEAAEKLVAENKAKKAAEEAKKNASNEPAGPKGGTPPKKDE